MWLKFKTDTIRRVRPKASGIVTSTIRYKEGMIENVPKDYGERLVAEGKAVATVSPVQKEKTDADQRPSPADGSASRHSG